MTIVRLGIVLLIVITGETYGDNLELSKNTTNVTNIPVEGGVVNLNHSNLTKSYSNPQKNTMASSTTTHSAREGVNRTTTPGLNVTNATSTTEKIIPVSEVTLPPPKNVTSTTEKVEVIGDSKIKPRKGAPKYVSPVVASENVTSRPKKMKPTVTIGSDDDTLSFVAHRNVKKNQTIKNESLFAAKYKPDFVLPIVLTILAVPLLAIILTILYKRGFEWWQHRHYRRMDFLIDGIYNN